jgi:hypothetical protein
MEVSQSRSRSVTLLYLCPVQLPSLGRQQVARSIVISGCPHLLSTNLSAVLNPQRCMTWSRTGGFPPNLPPVA